MYQFLSEFFPTVGDIAPNRDNLVQLPGFYSKASIYDMFKKHVTATYTADEHEVASKTLFKKIWASVYPNVSCLLIS